MYILPSVNYKVGIDVNVDLSELYVTTVRNVSGAKFSPFSDDAVDCNMMLLFIPCRI